MKDWALMESVSYGAGSSSAVSLLECRSKREYVSLLSYSESQRRSVNHFISQDNFSGSDHMTIHEPDSAATDPALRGLMSRDERHVWTSSRSREVEGFADSEAASASCDAVPGNDSNNFGGDSCFIERGRFDDAPLAAAISCGNAFTRTCELCGTSKTPLWRSGPLGAKSLCNACGIRSKKARRSAVDQHSESNCKNSQAEAGSVGRRFLKRKKFGVARAADQEAGWFSKRHRRMLHRKPEPPAAINHMRIFVPNNMRNSKAESSCVTSPGTPSPAHQDRRPSRARRDHDHRDGTAFARDEEQAAFLLMALSCGLVLA